MGTLEKEIDRLKSKPKDFTYNEAKRVLNNLGFIENNKGHQGLKLYLKINITKRLHYINHILVKF